MTAAVASPIPFTFNHPRPRPAPLALHYSLSRVPALRPDGPLVSPVWVPTGRTTPRSASFASFGSQSARRRPDRQLQTPSSPSPASATRRMSIPTPPEQEHFEALCRARFYDRDTDAQLQIDNILKEASVTAQACYNKILSTVRANFHDDAARQRREELDRTLAEATPDEYITKYQRRERLRAFLATHASKEMIGTHPFAKALYSMLSLQSTKGQRGGAGGYCLDWTLDDTVFMEAGPPAWARENIAILKTVLGMTERTEESSSESVPPSHNASSVSLPVAPALSTDSRTPATRHTRAPSDPFSDTKQTSSSVAYGPGGSRATMLHAGVLDEGRQRTFRMPGHIPNPELQELLGVFPAWLVASPVTFPTSDSPGKIALRPSLEELEGGEGDEGLKQDSSKNLKVATGHLQISNQMRQPGWEGSLLERVTSFVKRILGL